MVCGVPVSSRCRGRTEALGASSAYHPFLVFSKGRGMDQPLEEAEEHSS
jgi:hypothetical protein